MPIVTISRGTFSGGKELPEGLAADLSYPCVSRELIAEAAEHYGASQTALADALNQAPSLFDRLKRDRDRYLAYIRAEILQHARRGNFVYHGHGGQHLLAGIRHVIRIRVVADLAYRVREAMARQNMTSRQAEAHIKSVDEQRRKWSRFLYGVEWEDPSNYDAVLNLEYLGIAGARSTLVQLCRLEQFQPSDESRRALENLALASLVVAALARDERTRDVDLRVKADGGAVTIEGVVKVAGLNESIRAVASAVEGVRSVASSVVAANPLV